MTNIFDVVPQEEVVTIDENVDYVAELVGEGKKFKEVKDLARGKVESDRYIDILKKKNDELIKELNTRTSLDTFLDQMKAQKETNSHVAEPVQPNGQQTQALDDSSLEAKLNDLLARREAQRTQETNVDKVTRVLTEQYGNDAQLVINHKAQEVGMSPKELQQLASRSPQAFFKLVGVSESAPQSQHPVAPRSGVNSLAQPQSSGLRDSKYYENMKRTDPKKYFDDKTTVAMMRDRAELKARGLPW